MHTSVCQDVWKRLLTRSKTLLVRYTKKQLVELRGQNEINVCSYLVLSAEDNVFYGTNIKCYIEMSFSHKNSKPLDQVQAKVIVRDFVIHNYNYQFLLFFRKFASGFDIYISWLSELCMKGKHVYHNFIMPRNQFKKFLQLQVNRCLQDDQQKLFCGKNQQRSDIPLNITVQLHKNTTLQITAIISRVISAGQSLQLLDHKSINGNKWSDTEFFKRQALQPSV